MKDPHNYAKVGRSMIVVAASLTIVALLALAIGSNVLFSDTLQRDKTAQFNECKDNDFKTEGCEKYWDRINTDVSGIHVDLGK